MLKNLLGFATLAIALAPAGCGVEEEPSLNGRWEIAEKEGEVNPRPSDTVFLFTDDAFLIGVATAEGCCLHSAPLPYTTDASQTPSHLDYQGTFTIPGQIGIFEFVDDNTLNWKTTASDRPRPTDFAPNEPDCTLYQLRRLP